LTHWQIYPELEAAGQAGLAVIASLTVGIAACKAQVLVRRDARRLWTGIRPMRVQ
ncbi:MAG: hypothetical protein JWM84_411, partial [Nocardioides sp.]|nr:hypothetical protein [Nocardioides sp.]